MLFCSHRGIVKKGKEALQEKLDFLVSLRQQVHQLHREGASIAEITRSLLGREDFLSWFTFFHFSKRNLIHALARGNPSTGI